jgi:hypothetical protein
MSDRGGNVPDLCSWDGPGFPALTRKAAMTPLKRVSEEEIQRVNRLQRETFDKLDHLFDPPLPQGVPERLEEIVMHGKINKGDTVLDVGSKTGILIPITQKCKPRPVDAVGLKQLFLNSMKRWQCLVSGF